MDPFQPDGERPRREGGRWASYAGLWALTFMALGNAIQTAEGSN